MAPVARVAARLVVGLAAVLVLAAAALFAAGSSRLGRTYSLDYDPADIPSDSASLAHGRYLAESHGCTGCHAPDLGGAVAIDAPPFRVVASNLTSGTGGIGRTYTSPDWLRAIRHGVRPNGEGLYMMPSSTYWYLSDEEAGALVAYLQSLPAVDRELPRTEVKALGTVIAAIDRSIGPDLLAAHPERRRLPMPQERTASAALGAYRASVLCSHCHGVDMHGGVHPDPEAPPVPDLVAVKGWTSDGFVRAMRTGETPGGRMMDNAFMPWEHIGHLSDDELESLWMYFQTL
jgi:cytochrome c553